MKAKGWDGVKRRKKKRGGEGRRWVIMETGAGGGKTQQESAWVGSQIGKRLYRHKTAKISHDHPRSISIFITNTFFCSLICPDRQHGYVQTLLFKDI